MADQASADSDRGLYEELRAMALRANTATLQLDPRAFRGGKVFGALMEFNVDDAAATLFCAFEGPGDYEHIALYTSAGFGIIGENFSPEARRAAHAFVVLADAFANEMSPTDQFPGPRDNRVCFYLLTAKGVLTVEAQSLETNSLSDFGPLELAAHAVIEEISKVVSDDKN